MSVERHYFPGNNTPEGFFSYYSYILDQREAEKIVCIKGGPGTGKSTFMKKIGYCLIEAGYDVDFLHCSADEKSIDGVLIPSKKTAFIDGTSPHIIDPKTPGAVDQIINFGDYWNDKKIEENKEDIISYSEESSRWYKIAYNYLGAAKSIYNNLECINNEAIELSEVYNLASNVIEKEYKNHDISIKSGREKKFFATAITPSGNVSFVNTLLQDIQRVYLVNLPEGYGNRSFMNIIKDGALYRGFDVECYYCAMDPRYKIEHLIVPQLKLAFISTNKWHDIEPWEINEKEDDNREIIMVDFYDFISRYFSEKNSGVLSKLQEEYNKLIFLGIQGLSRAKENHDIVEKMYIRNMNFEKIDRLVEKVVGDIV